jgi:hypothetical protein
MDAQQIQILIPTLLWCQTKEHIFIDFQLNNVINEDIKFEETKIFFSGFSDKNKYQIEFDLSNNILIEESFVSTENNDKNIPKKIKLVLKKEENNEWAFLQKNKNLYRNNIKVNWDNWINDDSDEDVGENMMGDMDGIGNMGGMGGMEEMMRNMGGMGGMEEMMRNMGGMGNMEEMMKTMMGGKPDMKAMKNHLNQNMKMAKTKERMQNKLNKRKASKAANVANVVEAVESLLKDNK